MFLFVSCIVPGLQEKMSGLVQYRGSDHLFCANTTG